MFQKVRESILSTICLRTQFPNTVSELGVSSVFSSLNHSSGNICNISYSKYMTAKKFNYSKSINHRLSVSDSRGNQFRNCLEMQMPHKITQKDFLKSFCQQNYLLNMSLFIKNVFPKQYILRSQTPDLIKNFSVF